MKLTPEQESKLIWAQEEFLRGRFDGMSPGDIGYYLRKAGLDRQTIKAFGRWFIGKGLEEEWLIDELGF